jgi:hypothetical protein
LCGGHVSCCGEKIAGAASGASDQRMFGIYSRVLVIVAGIWLQNLHQNGDRVSIPAEVSIRERSWVSPLLCFARNLTGVSILAGVSIVPVVSIPPCRR